MDKKQCNSCGKPKCSCENKDFTKRVIEIDNPEQITLMRKVSIPASMGDDTAVPPIVGKYKNVLLYYEANHKSYLYSSDGIPTQLANGLTDYEEAVNLPEINGHTLIGDKTGPELGLQNEIHNIEEYARVFDTVADMAASTDLADGGYARTLGYYSIDDNGASLYKIVDDNSLTADGGSVIDLDNGLKAVLTYGGTINVAQFGIDATHLTNQNAFVTFVNATDSITTVVFNPIEYTYDAGFTFNKDTLTIIGNGCSIVPTNTVGTQTIFTISTDSLYIRDVTIDGKNMPQDQWSTASSQNICKRTCFNLSSDNILLEGVNILNVWGEGFYVQGGYKTVKLLNCVMDKIGGGFYKTDDQGVRDNFGDAIVLRGFNGNAHVSIENCILNGYTETGEHSRGSRCGILLGSQNNFTPDTINVFVKNTELTHFNRAIHIEGYSGKSKVVLESSNVIQDCSIAAYYTYNPVLIIRNSTINQTAENYNSSYGLAGGFIFKYIDSTLNIAEDAIHAIAMNGSSGEFVRSTINGIKDKQITGNSTTVLFKDSVLNFLADSSYTIFSGKVECHNCTFNAPTDDFMTIASNNGVPYYCDGCIFNNIYPNMRSTKLDNICNLSADPTDASILRNPLVFGNSTVLVNGAVISKPNISGCFTATEEYRNENTYVTANFGDSLTLPIIPSTLPDGFIPNKNRRYILAFMGTNSGAAYYNRSFANFYYTELTFDDSGTAAIGATVETVGNPASGNYELSFDTGAGTISKGTNSTYVNRVVYRILPYEWLSGLSTVSL